MASRDSWIDPDEVSGLAGEIFPEEKKAEKPEEEFSPLPLLDDEDVTAPNGVVADDGDGVEQDTGKRIAERLQAVRRRAERSGLLVGTQVEPVGEAEMALPKEKEALPSAVAAPLPDPFSLLPGARLAEQVGALVDWLAGDFEQVFVLDELGDELVVGDVPAGLRSGAVRLAQSWERSQGWLREDGRAAEAPVAAAGLADGRVMSVVGVRCAHGFYCAALVGGQMVSEAHACRVREALFLVFG